MRTVAFARFCQLDDMTSRIDRTPSTRLAHAIAFALCLASALMLPRPSLAQQDPVLVASLADLSLEELRDVVVSSVSRREQPLSEAAASIYVISGDEIRRAGVTTLPEALRLAPNLQVAAIDARQYAISARGFNGNVANKLLVMVDGRTIYSPLFSGVFWDAQDFVAADIDRIEVISGPAGATWGTNAVNGVINVVTLPASRTHGPSASLTLSNLEETATARMGLKLSDELSVRGHVKSFERAASQLRTGGDAGDASKGTFAGVRADWARGADAVSVNANTYRGDTDSRPVAGAVELSGTNLTGQWTRRLDAGSEFDVRAYFDHTARTDRYLLQEKANIFDVEAKLARNEGDHHWLAGLGYRVANERSEPGLLFAFLPPERRLQWYSLFAQDEVAVLENLALTLGLRMEHNVYSGWEALPSVRLGYTLERGGLVWSSLSRAVRSPSRFDRELFAPTTPPFAIAGGPDFDSEVANVAELGYRTQMGTSGSFSATAFIQDYDRLRSGEVAGSSVVFGNGIEGQVRGVEAWGSWQPVRAWRLDMGVLWLDKNLHLKPGSTDTTGPSNLGNDPRSQWSLRSIHRVSDQVDVGVSVRHVARLPSPQIPAYTATDFAINWRAHEGLQVSLGVRDAFDRAHAEYQGFASVSEIPRSAFVTLSYQCP
jgi:iron complex outermembrane receptor protein